LNFCNLGGTKVQKTYAASGTGVNACKYPES